MSLFLHAQRTKLPASARWVAWASPSHASRSPCLAFSRVSPRTASQSSRAMAALTFRRAPTNCRRWRAVGQAAAEPAHDVPDGVLVQQPALGGAGAPGDALGDPDFQPGQLFVAGRQRPGGDEDRAQVPQRLAVGSSSRAAWVRGRSPVASWRSTAESLLCPASSARSPDGRRRPGCRGVPAARIGGLDDPDLARPDHQGITANSIMTPGPGRSTRRFLTRQP